MGPSALSFYPMDQKFYDFGKLTRDFHTNEFLHQRRASVVGDGRVHVPPGVYDLICLIINGVNSKLNEWGVRGGNWSSDSEGVMRYSSRLKVNWSSLTGKIVDDSSIEVIYNENIILGVVNMENLDQVVEKVVAAIIFETI